MSTYFVPVTGQDGVLMNGACGCSGVRFDVRSYGKLFSKGGVRTFLGSRDDEGQKKRSSRRRNCHFRSHHSFQNFYDAAY